MNGYQPMDGERYWCIRGIRPWVCSHVWEGDRLDQLLRDTGRTFKTEDEARAALAPVSPHPPMSMSMFATVADYEAAFRAAAALQTDPAKD